MLAECVFDSLGQWCFRCGTRAGRTSNVRFRLRTNNQCIINLTLSNLGRVRYISDSAEGNMQTRPGATFLSDWGRNEKILQSHSPQTPFPLDWVTRTRHCLNLCITGSVVFGKLEASQSIQGDSCQGFMKSDVSSLSQLASPLANTSQISSNSLSEKLHRVHHDSCDRLVSSPPLPVYISAVLPSAFRILTSNSRHPTYIFGICWGSCRKSLLYILREQQTQVSI